MTVSDLIFRLLEFNSEDEVKVYGGFPLDYTDIRVSNTPNTVIIGSGIRGLKEIIDDLTDCANDLDSEVEDFNNLEDPEDTWDTYFLEKEIDTLNGLIDELADLSEV